MKVGDPNHGPEGQCGMAGRKGILFEDFTAGGGVSFQNLAIPGGHALQVGAAFFGYWNSCYVCGARGSDWRGRYRREEAVGRVAFEAQSENGQKNENSYRLRKIINQLHQLFLHPMFHLLVYRMRHRATTRRDHSKLEDGRQELEKTTDGLTPLVDD